MLLEGRKRGRRRGGYIKPFGDDWTSYLINYLDLVRAENLQQQAESPNANQPESQDVSGQFQEPEMRRLIENANQDPNPYWHFLAAM